MSSTPFASEPKTIAERMLLDAQNRKQEEQNLKEIIEVNNDIERTKTQIEKFFKASSVENLEKAFIGENKLQETDNNFKEYTKEIIKGSEEVKAYNRSDIEQMLERAGINPPISNKINKAKEKEAELKAQINPNNVNNSDETEEKASKKAEKTKWEIVDERTSKLPKQAFKVKETKDNTKQMLVMVGLIVLVASIFFGLKASSYYYATYGKFVETSETASSSNGNRTFGGANTYNLPPKPNAFNCLFGGITKEVPLDLAHINFGIFGASFIMIVGMAGVVGLLVWTTQEQNKAMRVGHEHGNTHIASKNDIKAYKRDMMENDNYFQIYSRNIGLSLNNRKTNRSANVLVIGGTGTGKTFKYIKPNLLQENSSAIITDPSGDLYRSFAPFLLQRGHNVYLFNVNDFGESSYYNPLLNVYNATGGIDEVKVDVLVDLYMKNAKAGKEGGGGDPFWDKAEKAFMTAIIYYVLENDDIPRRDKCFHTVLEKVQLAKAEMEDGAEASETILTKEINAWKEKIAREQPEKVIKTPIYYDTFLIAPDKTANTILITTAVDLQIFATEEVNRVTRYNEIYPELNVNFDNIAMTRTYVFLGIPQSHQAYNFLISMFYSQLYGRLYDLGERTLVGKYLLGYRREIPEFRCFDSKDELEDFVNNVSLDNIKEEEYINDTKMYHLIYKGKEYKTSIVREPLEKLVKEVDQMVWKKNDTTPELPIHVNFLLDEFKNIGEIPNFLTILSTSRKYRIGSHVVIQDIAQAQTIYKDKEYETLLANVDTTIFLGSILMQDKEEVQKMIGKTTIKVKSTSSSQGGMSTTYTPTEVPLVSLDELSKINDDATGRDDCYVIVRDKPVFLDHKALLFEHPNYSFMKKIEDEIKFDVKDYFENNRANIY